MRKILLVMLFGFIIIGLIACGNSVGEGDPLLSTPIGDFSYTQTYTKTHDDMIANSGYTILVIELTPLSGKGILIDTMQGFPIGDMEVILGEDKYGVTTITEHFSAEDITTLVVLVYVVPEVETGEVAELVLP